LKSAQQLFVHQEAMLLALRDDRGTAWGAWAAQAVGGGVLTDLVLAERVRLEGKRHLVTVIDSSPLGDPVLDESLERIASAKRRGAAQRWVSSFSSTKVFHATAERLCELGVLRLESKSVLLIFSRRVYPEIDPAPEREIVERLREAIFTDRDDIEPRIAVLVSLAASTELLRVHFDKKELKGRKHRIEQLQQGEAVGQATAAVIEGIQAAVLIATIIPAMTVTTSTC
jgi:Golgi phosphoprotein 3